MFAKNAQETTQLLLILVITVVCLFIFYFPAFMPGKILLDGDALYRYAPWSKIAPSDVDISNSRSGITDPLTQFFPWYRFSKQSFSEGKIPLWNPYVYCGNPFLANYQSSLFYPFTWPFLFFTIGLAQCIKIIGECLVAALGMYLLLRRYGVGWAATLPGIIVFLFSGFSVCWLQFPIFGVVCFFPLLLWSIEYCFLRCTLVRFVLMMFFCYCILTAGNPETVTHVLILTFLFFMFRGISMKKRGFQVFALFIGALLFAGILGAAQLLPFLEYVVDSFRMMQRVNESEGGYVFPLSFISLLFIPDFLGKGHARYIESTGYTGLFSLIFLFCLVIRRKFDSIVFAYSSIIVFSLSIAYGLFGLHTFLGFFPGSDVSLNHRILFGFGFGISVLTSYGLQSILDGIGKSEDGHTFWKVEWRCYLSGMIVLGITALVVLNWLGEALKRKQVTTSSLQENIDFFLVIWCICLLVICTAGIFRNTRYLQKVLPFIVSLVLFFDLYHIYHEINSSAVIEKLYPETRTITNLQRKLGDDRFTAIGNVIVPNLGMYFDLRDPRGYDALADKNYVSFVASYHPRIALGQGIWFKNPNKLFLDLVSVRFLLSEVPLPHWRAPNKPYGPIAEEMNMGDMWVYERGEPFERVSYYPLARCEVADWNSTHENFRLKASISSEMSGVFEEVVRSQHQSGEQPELNTETLYFNETGNTIEVRCVVSQPCLAFINTSYNHGWKAVVNEKKTSVLKVNGSFMGLILNIGENRLFLSYRPESFHLGLFLSLLGLLCAIALLTFAQGSKISVVR